MTVKEILIDLGMSGNEIKARLSNKQLKINGKPIKRFRNLKILNYYLEVDEFITCHDNAFINKLQCLKCISESFGHMFDNQYKSKYANYLKSFFCLQYSKTDFIILIKS